LHLTSILAGLLASNVEAEGIESAVIIVQNSFLAEIGLGSPITKKIDRRHRMLSWSLTTLANCIVTRLPNPLTQLGHTAWRDGWNSKRRGR
jgi:hypothetical protein